MKAFVDWVLARRYRSILLAIAFAPLLPVITAALMALETVRRGFYQGSLSAAIGIAGMLVIAVVSGSDVPVFAGLGSVSFISGVAIGALLLSAGTLGLTFQGIVLTSFVGLGCATLVGLDPAVPFGPVLEDLAQMLQANGASEQQIALVEGRAGVILLLGALFAQILGAMLLAHWWIGLAQGDPRFGIEFRRLALGRVLGITSTLLVGLGLVFDAALVQNLTPLAVLSFLFQGLAVLHAWAYARRWHPALLAPVYVLLVTPAMVVIFFALSAIGLIDNWFDLRAPLRSQL